MIFFSSPIPSTSTLQAFFDTEQTLKFPPSNPKEAFYISARQSFHYLPNDNQVAFAVKDGGSLVEIKMNRFFVLSLSLSFYLQKGFAVSFPQSLARRVG
jgi:hypothetical protein